MNDALYIAATGLQAQKQSVDTIANNLANVNTPGFKRATVQFHDMMQREAVAGGDMAARQLGAGVAITNTVRAFEVGELQRTDNPLELAIRGEGFLEVVMPDGTPAYTRGGALGINANGMLSTAEGHELRGGIRVGQDLRDLRIEADGTVSAADPNGGARVDLGRLDLVHFAQPSGLRPLGERLYAGTEASGEAVPIRAGQDAPAQLAQGHVERSNVRMVDEMVNLMVAQRAYEMNVKVIQAADDMLSMSNNLRR